ncbi:MAG: flagellar protein FlbB [Alphaproteobacteria bacterium]|nr:flagellar protein FlbB [Alphaproteobacteria bacterium]
MTLLQRIRILPLLVIVALLSLVVRVGEFATGVSSGSAMAQEEVAEPVPPLPAKDEEKPQELAVDAATEAAEEGTVAKAEEAAPKTETEADPAKEGPEWRDASETDYEYSEVRAELFRDLSKRREEIEAKEKGLTAREALLLAAERELDAKVRELTVLRTEIEALMKQQTDEEKARIASLVTIYEGMKAKDAARIFNTLDMDVLISVMRGMSERKSAPILAEMNAERARSVTILLAQEGQLPDMPPE